MCVFARVYVCVYVYVCVCHENITKLSQKYLESIYLESISKVYQSFFQKYLKSISKVCRKYLERPLISSEYRQHTNVIC